MRVIAEKGKDILIQNDDRVIAKIRNGKVLLSNNVSKLEYARLEFLTNKGVQNDSSRFNNRAK